MHWVPLKMLRGLMKKMAVSPVPKRPVGSVRDVSIDGPGGALILRIYQPAGEKVLRPLVVYFHGGGWFLGDLDGEDGACRDFCADLDCVVVSVDYRLAPEHRFPAAPDDCMAATRWAAAHAGELGADATRLALVGVSAGATLAITTALRCAAEGGPALHAIAPICPVTDLRAPSIHASRREFGIRKYGLTQRDVTYFTGLYLRDPDDALHPWVSPLLAPDLGSLPPCLLVTAQCDLLRDEGAALADAIAAAGAKVDYRCFAGLPHAFVGLGAVPIARRAIDEITAALGKLLEPRQFTITRP
jgi:acetyl esterase